MKATTKSLEQKIGMAVEQLVREHLAACEAAAALAVHAAFERASQSRAPSRCSRPKPAGTRTPAPCRSRAELAALEERLYEAIRQHPGETMAVIAPVVGSTPGALNWPARKLRHKGRIRSIGQCQFTRYFPMGE